MFPQSLVVSRFYSADPGRSAPSEEVVAPTGLASCVVIPPRILNRWISIGAASKDAQTPTLPFLQVNRQQEQK
jgi:hypothetical protein